MTASGDDPARWWLAGPDGDALLGLLDRLAPTLPAPGPAARGTTASRTEGRGPARLGIVAPDERKVRLARRLVAKGEPWRGRSDIWFTPAGFVADPGAPGDRAARPAPGRIAFLFPGVEPNFGADTTDLPTLAERIGLPPPPVADDTVAHRSASIYQIGIFLDRVLRRMGVAPDVVAGHSIGEWSGTVAAAMVPRSRAHELLEAADLDAVVFPDLDFAALAAGVEAVAPVLERAEGIDGVVVSHDNSPRQAVICGPPEQMAVALERLRAEGILGYTLPFQSGFHTPAVAPLIEAFRAEVRSLPFGEAAVPMWSATTVAPYPTDRAEILDLHLRHLVEPVRFRPLVERLYHDAGVRIFVQVGLGSLTGFVNQTLDGLDHASVPMLSTKRSALAQAHRAMTALWVEGVEVEPRALLGTSEAPATPATVRGGPTSLAAAAEVLSAAAHASRDVVEALAARLAPAATPGPPLPPPAVSASSTPGARPAVTPSPGGRTAGRPTPVTAWPDGPVTVTRHMSLETMPETLDHTLFDQPEGWPDPSDRFPIVAMTTQIQLLQDIVAELTGADGRAGRPEVVEVSGIRNTRWLDLSDPHDVDVTVAPKSDDVLSLTLGRHCRANLRVGRFPPAPRPDLPPLVAPRPTDHTAAEMFEQRLMFHGPRFHGITSLGPIGDNGMAGEFHQLDTPGSLLDNLGKLIAYWVMAHYGLGEAALPIGVERIELFGPNPPPGTPIHCDIRIVDLQRDAVTADGVLVLPDGTVWGRVTRWTSIVFHRDELMEPLYYQPTRCYAAERQPGGWSVTLERWPTGPGRELTARRYMSRSERKAFEQLNLLQQRRLLIDVVAAKDAVRQWLWDTYQVPSYPVQVSLEDDGDRRYRAVSDLIPAGHDLRIVLSSIDWLAVALLTDGEPGDIEVQEIPTGEDPATVGRRLAEAMADRHPGIRVGYVAPVEGLTPSRLEVVSPPPFAVAWTVRDDVDTTGAWAAELLEPEPVASDSLEEVQ